MAPTLTHLPPLEVASETFLLRSARPVEGAPLLVYTNSLVIRGAEPVVVDTGSDASRDHWLADLTTLIEPARVRWVVLSHDSADRRGNLARLCELSPSATVATCWSASQRTDAVRAVPPRRLRWIHDDDSLDVGDRRLRTLRPPVYDSPASRAVFDPVTGVLWTSEVFMTPMPPQPVERIDELPPGMWVEGTAMLHHHAMSPWLRIVDRGAYAGQVDRLRGLDPAVVVAAHAPVITGPDLEAAFTLLAALPDMAPPPHPAHPSGVP